MKRIMSFITEMLMPSAIKNFMYRLFYTPSYLFNKHEGINELQNIASQTAIAASAIFLLLKENHGVVVGNLVVVNIDGGVNFISLDYIKINESLAHPDVKIENGTIVYINVDGELDKPPTDN